MRKMVTLIVLMCLLVAGSLLVGETTHASGSKIITRGTTVTLNWSVANAPNCSANTTYTYNGDNVLSIWQPNSSKAGAGSNTFTPTAIGNFTFGCSYTDPGTGAQTSDSAALQVNDCAAGTTWNGSSCGVNGCSNGANNPPACNSCPAGQTWNGSSCVSPSNGSCSATHYGCASGTPANQTQGASAYTWSCLGSNGGSNASCSESISGAPSCTGGAPQASNTTATSGSFFVYAYGVSSNVTSMYFPTWGVVNGQNDLIWYPGTNMGGGTWRATINLANHVAGNPEYGTFETDIYMNSPGYTNVGCIGTQWSRTTPVAPTCTSVGPQTPSTVTGTSGPFYVYAYGVSSNATSVLFPTWSDVNGQNDLIWYTGSNMGGGTWRAAVDLGSHLAGNPEYGSFSTHVYMYSPDYVNVWCNAMSWARVAPTNNGACVGLSAPTSVTTGSTFSASVTMNNNGSTDWTQSGGYKLGSQPQDNQIWGLSRVLLPVASVASGQNTTFNFTGTAPSTPGTYPFGWAMLQEGVQWFGGTCTQNITVTDPTPTATISASPNPCTVAAGGNTCSSNVTWNIVNATPPNVFSSYTNGQVSTAASGSGVAQTVAIGGTTFTARSSTTNLAATTVTGVCNTGLAYSGGVCAACSNGGCTGSGGGPSSPNGGLSCNNGAPNPPSCTLTPTATLSANPSTIDSGQSSTLSWSSSNATSCAFASEPNPPVAGGRTSGSTSTGVLSSTQNYQITCNGTTGGTANSNIATVTVLQPNVSITASPARVRAGGTSTITWTASQVTSCTVTGPSVNSGMINGSQVVTITKQSTYTMTCQTNGAPITRTAIVNIAPDFQEF